MKEGKVIVGLSTAFLAGILTGNFFGSSYTYEEYLCCSLIFSTSIYLYCTLKFTSRKYLFIYILFFILGIQHISIVKYLKLSIPIYKPSFYNIHLFLIQKIEDIGFSSDSFTNIVKALILGDKTDLDTHLIQQFRESGLAHILALSGLHLGILYYIIKQIITLFNSIIKVKILRSCIAIATCAFYLSICYPSSSLSRAFIFICIYELSKCLERKISLENILFSSLFIQCLLFPLDIFSISFQLSYVAILGICYIYPFLSSIFSSKDNYIFKLIWDLSALSISCQISSTAISYYYFRQFPKYFIISNLLCGTISSIIIALAFILLCLSCLSIKIPLLVSIEEGLINYLIWCISNISTLN